MFKKKVIIDCDNTMGLPGWEVDDGLVILYLLGRDDIEVLGITNTFGNGSLKDVAKYTKELLKSIGREDIPRFNGEPFFGQNKSLTLDIRSGNRYFGELDPQNFPSEAAKFLVEQATAYPGEISLLALGPVGNLYDAWKLDKNFYKNINEIILMGGYTHDLFIGDTPCRELNLSCNPEAAFNMLNAECPRIIFNGHICLQAPFKLEDMSRINFWPESRKKIIHDWFRSFSNHYSIDAFYLWDLLPAVYLSFPEIFDLKDVAIEPTVKSLHKGMLQKEETNIPNNQNKKIVVTMPDNILNNDLLMKVIEEAWQKEWQKESKGWIY